jgi:ribosomal protein S18 acetylase RimI-like enzyme
VSAGFTVRPARADEVSAAAELLNDHSRRLYGKDDTTADELRMYWESPDVDFELDVLLAEADEGGLLGYADLGFHGRNVWFDIRGFDPEPLAALLEAIEARAREKEPDAGFIGYVSEEDNAVRDLYERAGYLLIRHSFRMEVDLDGKRPKPTWLDGVTVRTLRAGEEERVYEAHMESFADTWMFTHEPFHVWSHWFVKDPAFDPSLWFLAEERDELVGIALTRPSETEADLGWVRVLGVAPTHRRRGLGEALLRHTFEEFHRRRFERVGLGVDAENPTGAVRLYEAAGMHVSRLNLLYERVQP